MNMRYDQCLTPHHRGSVAATEYAPVFRMSCRLEYLSWTQTLLGGQIHPHCTTCVSSFVFDVLGASRFFVKKKKHSLGLEFLELFFLNAGGVQMD